MLEELRFWAQRFRAAGAKMPRQPARHKLCYTDALTGEITCPFIGQPPPKTDCDNSQLGCPHSLHFRLRLLARVRAYAQHLKRAGEL